MVPCAETGRSFCSTTLLSGAVTLRVTVCSFGKESASSSGGAQDSLDMDCVARPIDGPVGVEIGRKAALLIEIE